MGKNDKKDLTSCDAFDIMCSLIRQKADGLDYGTIEFDVKLKVHNAIITDAYLGQHTKDGFVVTEHLRSI